MLELYKLKYEPKGVSMCVTSDMGSVVRDSIVMALKRKRLSGLNMSVVNHLVMNPNTWEIIAPEQTEFVLDEEAQISVARDRMNAYVSFTPPDGGKLLDISKVLELLKQAGVVYGIKKEVLLDLAGNKSKAYNQNIVIASGTPGVDGSDAIVAIRFPIVRDKTPKVLENGQVDFKNVERPNLVKKGMLLAEFTPATIGVSGFDVNGTEIKMRSGKQKAIPAGKYVTVSDDGRKLYAQAEGYAEIIDGRITVLRLMEIKGDVGPSTGHIDFPGDVIVSGNVVKGFNIKAGGSVTVKGCIEASEIVAGSDVVIGQGVKGMSTRQGTGCRIIARGNVTCKYVEHAIVVASGIVRSDMIINSDVQSLDTIEVTGKIGSIIGGKLYALRNIAAMTVGSEDSYSSASTFLSVGVTSAIRARYVELRTQIENLEADMMKLSEEIYALEAEPNLKNEKRAHVLKIKRSDLEDTLFPIARDARVIRDAMKIVASGEINVTKKLFSPVKVMIGETERTLESPEFCVTLYSEAGTIATMPCDYKFK
ncbi:hypothetical protein AGMMS49975_04570 [Clostridia bacterium]|nr:hypothetical protein AGMMS49975_04570 [Clostridia bacterium]